MAATSIETCDVRWDLSDLFNSIDDPKIEATLKSAAQRSDDFAARHRGKMGTADAATLKSAILELEALVSDLTKPIQYANLLFAADTSNPKLGAFLQKMVEASSEILV
jgi:oligoendopeptidase F